MTNKKKVGFADVRVGMLVLLSIGILIAMILAVSGDIPLQKSLTVRTKLSQVDGLRPGTEVRLAGVSIGKVSEVNLLPVAKDQEEKRSVEVVMKIDPEIDGVPAQKRIRTDSRVILGSVGLLGDKVIEITPGTTDNGQEIKDNDEILGAQETSIKQLVTGASDIMSNFNLLSTEVKQIAEKINRGEGTAGKFIADEALYNNLNRTVIESQELVKRVREGEGTVGKLLNDPKLYEEIRTATNRMEALVADISNGRGTIGKLATDDELYVKSNKMLARLDQITDKLEQTANRIDRGEGTIGRLINEDRLYRETETTLVNLNKMSARLERGEGSAGKLLQDPELYNNLNTASSEINKLLFDFRKDPKKYLTIKIRIF
jgi:phospholipid/cholesterol/gamma-HCH transport system substrate-binding protein